MDLVRDLKMCNIQEILRLLTKNQLYLNLYALIMYEHKCVENWSDH